MTGIQLLVVSSGCIFVFFFSFLFIDPAAFSSSSPLTLDLVRNRRKLDRNGISFFCVLKVEAFTFEYASQNFSFPSLKLVLVS